MKLDHNHVDLVLNALRDAMPPAGMERRILNTLEAKAHKPAQASRSHINNGWIAAAVCCSALAAVAVIGAFIMRHHGASAISITRTPSPQSSNPLQPSVTRAVDTTVDMPTRRPLSAAPRRLAAQPRLIQIAQSEATGKISHPAPPIPLTDQERILLSFARRGRTDDLAQISNDRKAAKEDQEKQEFQAFFEPPPIKIGESE